MYVVTGVSGKTGSAAAEALLAGEHPVRVVVRDAKKGAQWKARGAEVAVADFEDGDSLADALLGARGVYLLLPPFALAQTNLAASRDKVVRGLLHAVKRARPAHVVLLSSIGAQHAAGTGPITAMHVMEKELATSGVPMTFLRASYFMENWRASIPAVLGAGQLFSGLHANLKIPMVAARDIGETAAKLLLAPLATFATGPRVVELSGPEEYSLIDTAAALSTLFDKKIQATEMPIAGAIAAMLKAGASQEFADAYGEMTAGINDGLVAWERGASIPMRGQTPLRAVLAEIVEAAQKR